MNRAELVKEVKSAFEVTEKEAKAMLETFESIVEKGILEDGEVSVHGGKFKVKETKAKMCLKNPKKPELGKMEVPASHKVGFSAGKDLKEKVKSL